MELEALIIPKKEAQTNMAKKVLRKTRTGQWIVAAVAALAVGGAAVATNNNTTDKTVGPETKAIDTQKSDDNASTHKVEKKSDEVNTKSRDLRDTVLREASDLLTEAASIAEVETPAIKEASMQSPQVADETPATSGSNQVAGVAKPQEPTQGGRISSVLKDPRVVIVGGPFKVEDPKDVPGKPFGPIDGSVIVGGPFKVEDPKDVVPPVEAPAETPVTDVPKESPVADKPVAELPKAETPADKPAEQPAPVETPKDTTTVISTQDVPKELPADQVVKPGGEVVGSDTKVISNQEIPGQTTPAPQDTPQTDGGTTSTVAPGSEVVTPAPTPAPTPTPAEGEATVEQPVEQPADITRTDTATDVTTINYGVSYVKDTTLAPGATQVITKGVNGSRTVVTSITYVNGIETGRTVVSDTTVPAVNEVVAYNDEAPATREEVVETTNTIAHGVERRATTDLKVGEERVAVKGVNGTSVTKTLNIYDAAGTLISSTEQSTTVVSEPVTEIIEYGVTPVDTVEVSEERTSEVLDFQTEERQTDELYKGETRVIVEGRTGYQVKIAKVTKTNGVETAREVTNGERVEPINRVVEVGTRERTTTETREVVEEIDFQTEVRNNAELKKGERRTVTKGVKGQRTVKITTVTIGGQVVETRDVISETAPVNEVIEVGTKEDIRHEMRVDREDINFNTVTRKTDALFEGETREVTQGSKGRKVTTYKDTYVDGKLVGTEIVGEPVVTPAVDRVIEIGTKKEVVSVSVETTETINFKTITETDDQLEEGKTKIRVNGVNGSRKVRITRTTNNRTGETTETKEVISETPATDEVLVIGTKPKVISQPDYMTKTSLTLDEFEVLTEDQQDAFLARNNTFVSGTSARKGELTQEKVDKIEKLINLDKVNLELVRLINDARASEGLPAVTYAGSNSFIQVAANTRANEMADYGSLRYRDTPDGAHKRPDGSKFSTVYSDEDYARMTWRGENAIQFGSAISPEKAANEVYLAKTMFEEWMASSGHRAIMLKNLNNIQIAVGVGVGVDDYQGRTTSGVTIGMLMLGQLKP